MTLLKEHSCTAHTLYNSKHLLMQKDGIPKLKTTKVFKVELSIKT